MNTRFKTALAMSPREWAILTRAWIAFFVISVALRLVSVPRLRRFLLRGATGNASAVSLDTMRRLVNRAARLHPARVVCLQRSLCLEYLLHRQGTAADFRLGVRRSETSIEAHAWVEVAGQPLGEDESLPSFRSLEAVR